MRVIIYGLSSGLMVISFVCIRWSSAKLPFPADCSGVLDLPLANESAPYVWAGDRLSVAFKIQ